MELIKVLCVDDEPNVLSGLRLQLRREYEVTPALNAAEGIAALREQGPFAVVLTDMRMPGMNGAAFLAVARDLAPDTIRMVLTGQADFPAAISAVNNGQVFRFLTKPCPPDEMRAAFKAAVEQHRLLTSQRELLERTLRGSVRALIEILSLVSPEVFGQADRVSHRCVAMATAIGISDIWQVEVAALLAQIGGVSLPDETAARWSSGQRLSHREEEMVRRVPMVTDRLLANIPRLEAIRAIIAMATQPSSDVPAHEDPDTQRRLVRCAEVLRVALEFERLERSGKNARDTAALMRYHRFTADQAILDALDQSGRSLAVVKPTDTVVQVTLEGLEPGMVLAEDVRTSAGMLLAARGYFVTAGFVERARNFAGALESDEISVLVPPSP